MIEERQACVGMAAGREAEPTRCGKRAKFMVSGHPACGIHLAQVVKFIVREDGKAVVAAW